VDFHVILAGPGGGALSAEMAFALAVLSAGDPESEIWNTQSAPSLNWITRCWRWLKHEL